jgi:mitogen-activated protein kinase organizer 1
LSGGSDSSICFWDLRRSTVIRKLRCHNGAVNCVAFNHDSSVAISGSYDSTVKLWDARCASVNPIQTLEDSKDAITAVASGRFDILSGSVDGKLRTYDIRQSCLTVDSFPAAIVSIELSKDQQIVLLSTIDSKVLLFVKPTGEMIQTYRGHTSTQFAIHSHFAANDAVVVSGSETGEVFIWELVEAAVANRFRFGEGAVLDVAVQTPFVSLAAGSANGDIGLFRKG